MTSGAHVPGVQGIEDLVLVGQGGFASVYRGHQVAFRRDVAVKVIQRSELHGEDRRRFERECQAMGAVSDHPGIVTLYDAGFTDDERPYLVMEFVSGGTLHDRLAAGGPMSWSDVTRLGVQLSGALETAHRAGVLHRDIKPGNVLHADYGDKLSDFGIARIQGGHETRSGIVTASVNHAAPEILNGRPPTAQADIYGLASTLYEALTGSAPFERPTDEGLLPLIHRVMTEAPADLRAAGVPDALVAVIERAMSKEPGDRYATAEEFGLALRGAQAALGMPVTDLVIVGAATAAGVTHQLPPTEPPAGPPAESPATAVMSGAAPPPHAEVGSTTVIPPTTPTGAPPRYVERDDDRGGPGKAVLIFAALAALVAVIVGAIVIANDDDGGGADPTVPPGTTLVPETTLAPDTTLAPETTLEPETTLAPETTVTTLAPTTLPPTPLEQLSQLIVQDAPIVDTLVEQWVPQLSAKRVGLEIDGVTFGPEEILADHLVRRDEYGAILVDGATYNFRLGDQQMVGWYLTMIPLGFPTADGALGWCLDQNIDRDNCIAKFISTTVFDGTTQLNP